MPRRLPAPPRHRASGEVLADGTRVLYLRTKNPTNNREHWRTVWQRAKRERTLAHMWLDCMPMPPKPPCTVRLTRVSPSQLDDDNLRPALKSIRDGVADALGIDDRDPRVTWQYAQAKGQHSVRIEVLDGQAQREAVAKVREGMEGR